MQAAASSMPVSRSSTTQGKVTDITGPGITDRWGVTCADLGASVRAPNGTLVSVFGDTFSGNKVGRGDWRSPVLLIGTGDAGHEIRYHRAGGDDSHYARQLWRYAHSGAGLFTHGISTVIPSDLLRVDDALYLHSIVNRGFGNVVWTEIWRSDDSGISWQHLGKRARFPGGLHRGYAQCWSWDYNPDDGWVYVVSTGFQRDKGVILQRVRPANIGNGPKYSGWGVTDGRWSWDSEPSPITPDGETWGELSLRRLPCGKWILGGFLSSKYALGYRVLDSLTAVRGAPIQIPVVGTAWDREDHADNRVAQLYGGYILPGSRLGQGGGVGLVVSQWNTAAGWPYRAMQFQVTLRDTTRSGHGSADQVIV